jgi:Mg-chelatase subunit ChlD
VLGHSAISTVIPGIKNAEQAERNAAASGEPGLSDANLDTLHHLYDSDFKHFLDHLRQAHAILHIVDASGSTDSEGNPVSAGSHDPTADIKFLGLR